MSTIPETRTIGPQGRINVPQEIAEEYGDGATFTVHHEDDRIIARPCDEDDGRALSSKNRLRLPPSVADEYTREDEFVVLSDDRAIVYRPVDTVDIQL